MDLDLDLSLNRMSESSFLLDFPTYKPWTFANMTIKIDSKIHSVEVVADTSKPAPPELQVINEKLRRPKVLMGTTYQLKTPLSEYTWYITINNVVLNEGTEHEKIRPFEIFLNTKDAASYQWTVFASRMLSAIFRKGGDVKFILEEMASVHQPNGGYLSKTGYTPSLVAEIGKVIEQHFRSIGIVQNNSDESIREYIDRYIKTQDALDGAEICPKCGARAYVRREGCGYCTECYESKCG